MNDKLANEIREISRAVHYQPSVSILMPLNARIGIKAELVKHLKFKTDQLQRELQQKYSKELVDAVLTKLGRITENLEWDTKKKGMAIFVSPVFEKVMFLDMPLEERMVVDESFEVRDLVLAGKTLHRYLAVILSGTWTKTLLGNSTGFLKLNTGVPDNINAISYDVPERVSNFSDPNELKEMKLKHFLQQADAGLSNILKEFSLPVFILGTKKNLGYFKQLTGNEKNIAGYVQGNYEESSETELRTILKPHISEWQNKSRDILYEIIEKAAGAGKLSMGISEVWRIASQHRGRLLIVEKNYMYPATFGEGQENIEPYTGGEAGIGVIRDAVDDLIEKVMNDGGEVEFVEEGMLENFQKIVLIQYY